MAEFGRSETTIAYNPGVGTATLKLDEIDLGGGKPAGEDFLGQLDAMAKRAEARKLADESTLRLDDIDLGDVSIREDFVIRTREDELLGRAKALMAEEKFAEAREPLLILLEEVGEHHEAIFLLALCHFHAMEPVDALRLLNRLGGRRMEAALAARVGILRAQVRGTLQTTALLENMFLFATGNFELAAARVRELVEVDPEEWLYHFMLAGSLMKAEQHEAALKAIQTGLDAVGPGDRARLEPLRAEVETSLARAKMAVARALYRRGKFGAARSKLRRLDPACRATRLWQTFDGYLQRLDGGPLGAFRGYRGPSDVQPPGSMQEAEALYQFLVEEEMLSVRERVDAEDFVGATLVLLSAVIHVPHYSYARFLLAGSIYREMGDRIAGGDPPPLDELTARLESALGHARIGALDPEIRDGQRLLEEIERLLQHLKNTVREAEAVHGAIEEFHGIMSSVKDGITSLDQLKAVRSRLQKLRDRMPAVRQAAASEEAVEAVGQLDKALGKHLKDAGEALTDLEAAKSESKLVNEAAKEFVSIMKKAKGGIRTRGQLEKIESRLKQLRERVRTLRGTVKSSQSKKALDELRDAVDKNLGQIDSARGGGGGGGTADGGIVDMVVDAVNQDIQQIESGGGVHDHQERQKHRNFLEASRGVARDLRERATSSGDRQKLDALIESVDRAISRYL